MEDRPLERLLDLDGEIFEVGGGYWVEITAVRIPVTAARPHGINYALRLFDPKGKRLVCYDNAHAPHEGRAPSRRKSIVHDHRHFGERVRPYVYSDAETLLADFWTDVERVLKDNNVP
jgi:hypothetical protein